MRRHDGSLVSFITSVYSLLFIVRTVRVFGISFGFGRTLGTTFGRIFGLMPHSAYFRFCLKLNLLHSIDL